MREIKFRIWDTAMEKFVGSEFLHLNWDGSIVNVFDNGRDVEDWTANKKAVLQQYTGLKDKNGKEIYEGDIVYMVANGVNGPREIQFLNGAFGIKPLKVSEDLWWIEVWHMDVKIIGNVWENPKLLEANHE